MDGVTAPDTLPPLPEPRWPAARSERCYVDAWSAEQMRAHYAAGYARGRADGERAAHESMQSGLEMIGPQIQRLRDALLHCARLAEALKRPCGMDPEDAQAVRNGQYMAISDTAHIALGTVRGPAAPGYEEGRAQGYAEAMAAANPDGVISEDADLPILLSIRVRDVLTRCAAGIDHLSALARLWEPDYSSGSDRRGWVLANDALDDARELLKRLPPAADATSGGE